MQESPLSHEVEERQADLDSRSHKSIELSHVINTSERARYPIDFEILLLMQPSSRQQRLLLIGANHAS